MSHWYHHLYYVISYFLATEVALNSHRYRYRSDQARCIATFKVPLVLSFYFLLIHTCSMFVQSKTKFHNIFIYIVGPRLIWLVNINTCQCYKWLASLWSSTPPPPRLEISREHSQHQDQGVFIFLRVRKIIVIIHEV